MSAHRPLWIVDTNVLVAGLLSRNSDAPPVRIVDAMLATRLRYLISVELLAEYRTVLLRSKIRERLGWDENEMDRLLEAVSRNAVVADLSGRDEMAPDPGDHHLWQLLAARPEAGLITGDSLLLQKAPPGAWVLTPRDWLHS